MVIKGNQAPTIQEEVIYRPLDQLQLFDHHVINDLLHHVSPGPACAPFRKFGLYVFIDSTLAPTTLQIEVEFLDRWSNQWYQYKQGLFAALFWEDTDTALGIYEAFVGDVLGRAIRVKLTGVGTDLNNFFTVSVAVDFWN